MTEASRADAAPLHTMRFDATGWRPREALDYFHEEVRPLYDIYPTAATPPDWNVDLRAWQLDDLLFSKVRTDAHGARRDKTHLRQAPSEFVRLRISYDSSTLVNHDGVPLRLESGALQLVDFNREMELIVPDGEQISVFIPHAAIGYDTGRHPASLRFGIETGSGLVLHRSLMALMETLPHLRQDEAPALARGFAGLLQGLVSGALESHDENSIQAARSSAMRQYLDERLADPTLGLETLTSAFGASRATIYRDFASFGGIERYIAGRRLEMAFRNLAQSPPRRGAVSAIAEAWGFTSIHHFSRLFRTRFGVPPGEVVGVSFGERTTEGGLTLTSSNAPGPSQPALDAWFSRV